MSRPWPALTCRTWSGGGDSAGATCRPAHMPARTAAISARPSAAAATARLRCSRDRPKVAGERSPCCGRLTMLIRMSRSSPRSRTSATERPARERRSAVRRAAGSRARAAAVRHPAGVRPAATRRAGEVARCGGRGAVGAVGASVATVHFAGRARCGAAARTAVRIRGRCRPANDAWRRRSGSGSTLRRSVAGGGRMAGSVPSSRSRSRAPRPRRIVPAVTAKAATNTTTGGNQRRKASRCRFSRSDMARGSAHRGAHSGPAA